MPFTSTSSSRSRPHVHTMWGGIKEMQHSAAIALIFNTLFHFASVSLMAGGHGSYYMWGLRDTKVSHMFNMLSVLFSLANCLTAALPLFPWYNMDEGVICMVLNGQLIGLAWRLAALSYTANSIQGIRGVGFGLHQPTIYQAMFGIILIMLAVNFQAVSETPQIKRVPTSLASFLFQHGRKDFPGRFLRALLSSSVVVQASFLLLLLNFLKSDPIHFLTGTHPDDITTVDRLAMGHCAAAAVPTLLTTFTILSHGTGQGSSAVDLVRKFSMNGVLLNSAAMYIGMHSPLTPAVARAWFAITASSTLGFFLAMTGIYTKLFPEARRDLNVSPLGSPVHSVERKSTRKAPAPERLHPTLDTKTYKVEHSSLPHDYHSH